MSKRAVILAGGKGTRLKPFTVSFPKPLVPVGDFPILEIIIRQLVHHGFDHITLTVNHLAELIRSFFGDGSKWGITIDYSYEDSPLGTMGPLKLIQDLPDHFLVMNGDILSDINYGQLYDDHVKEDPIFTINSYLREHVNLYGVLHTDEQDILTDFEEKPISRFRVSMGVYTLSKRVLDFVPPNKPFGFDQLMLKLIDSDEKVKVRSFDGHWLDIGRPDDYTEATELFENNRSLFLPE